MKLVSVLFVSNVAWAYLPASTKSGRTHFHSRNSVGHRMPFVASSKTPTSLDVWWFGGTEQNEVNANDEECELVAVRIERTSANSRRIAGEIAVPATLDDVWSILTDYDRLAIHVPNLMESRITQRNSPGRPGDGSFRCRLFQKGSQKIIGFDFSASVTMDMTEKPLSNGDRAIVFKCVDSQFFSEFDGQWTVKEQVGADGNPETICYYMVDVRPKGPVPVAALEWRIREDVPSNLRAVKAATLRINAPNMLPLSKTASLPSIPASRAKVAGASKTKQGRLEPMLLDWDRDETMAKYL
jgi:Polyketide cyclase / dehydrase and lipid transport